MLFCLRCLVNFSVLLTSFKIKVTCYESFEQVIQIANEEVAKSKGLFSLESGNEQEPGKWQYLTIQLFEVVNIKLPTFWTTPIPYAITTALTAKLLYILC